jgi:CHAT domain
MRIASILTAFTLIVSLINVNTVHAKNTGETCGSDAAALEKFVALQSARYQSAATPGSVPNPRSLARQTIEDIEHWSAQRPHSALVLIGPSPLGICAWVWQGKQASSVWLSGDIETRSNLFLAAQMNLPGRSAIEQTQTETLDDVRQEFKRLAERWLPKPLLLTLSKSQEIIVLPMDALAHLPWNALLIQYLARDTATPSVVLASSFKSALETRLLWEPIGAGDKVLVVGNPDYRGSLRQLPGAETEARHYAKFFNIEPIVGANATVERISKEMESADIAFLATHGLSPANMPSGEGAIVLANGLLTSERIRSLRFQKKSVIVLSATQETLVATQQLQPQGLARALQQAGAVGVIMSLWSGDDSAIIQLMQYFVQELKSAPPGLALIRAQVRLRQSNPDPRHWGAFNYYGKPIQMR